MAIITEIEDIFNEISCGADLPVSEVCNPEPQDIWENGGTTIININNYGQTSYIHNQNISSSTWAATHNLGRRISGCRVIDTGGNEWTGLVTDIDNNNCIIDVGPYPFAGIAYLI